MRPPTTAPLASAPIAAPYLADARTDALPWRFAVDELARSDVCWLATSSPDGRPHVVPVLVVVVGEVVHLAAAPGTRKARNLARDPRATVTTHGQQLDVVVEGEVDRVLDGAWLGAVAATYASHHGWEVEVRDAALHADGAPTAGPGPYHVHRLRARRAFGFPTEGELTPTRWTFAEAAERPDAGSV